MFFTTVNTGIMKNWKQYLIIFLLVGWVAREVFKGLGNKSLDELKIEMKEEQKIRLKKVRDSAARAIDTVAIESAKKTDSLLKANYEIKYVPYEKKLYVDRDLERAIRIIDCTCYRSN